MPLLPFTDLKEYAGFTEDFVNWARRQKQAGKTIDQAAAEYTIPAKYKGYVAAAWLCRFCTRTTPSRAWLSTNCDAVSDIRDPAAGRVRCYVLTALRA